MVSDSNHRTIMTHGKDKEVRFDIIINTEKGAIHVGYFKCTVLDEAAAAVAPTNKIKVTVWRVHQMVGHCGE